jgi:hypothetical protein
MDPGPGCCATDSKAPADVPSVPVVPPLVSRDVLAASALEIALPVPLSAFGALASARLVAAAGTKLSRHALLCVRTV